MEDSLILWVNWLVVVAWAALLPILATQAALWAYRNRKEALLVAALFGFALLVRLLTSDRLPTVSSHTDFTQLRSIIMWLRDGLGRQHGFSPPPGFQLLYWVLFKITGPNLDVAFGFAVVMGSATVMPVYAVSKLLSGSVWGGVLGALAFAVYPPAVVFCNGVAMESGAGLLLALNVAAFLVWVRGGGILSAVAYALSMVLFVQSRGEGLALGGFVALGQLMIAVDMGQLRRLLRFWPIWLAGAVWVVPFTVAFLQNSNPAEVGEFRRQLISQATIAVAMGTVVTAWAHGVRKTWRWAHFLGLAWMAAMGVWACSLAWTVLESNALSELWFSQARTLPEFPYVTFYGLLPTPVPHFLTGVGVFPIAFLPLALLSLLPKKSEGRLQVWVAPIVIWALPQFVDTLLAGRATGHVVIEGFRYQVPHAGLVAIAVGTGAFRLQELLAGHAPSWRTWATRLAVFTLVLGPLATHQAVMTDTVHNIQREFLFLDKALEQDPPGAIIVVPDFNVRVYGSGDQGLSVAERFRVEHLLFAMSAMKGRTVSVRQLWKDRAALQRLRRDVFVYLGQDCYRLNDPMTEHPWCQWARQTQGFTELSYQTIRNRRFCGAGIELLGPRTPTLDLGWYRVTPEGIRRWIYQIETHPVAIPDAPGAPLPTTSP